MHQALSQRNAMTVAAIAALFLPYAASARPSDSLRNPDSFRPVCESLHPQAIPATPRAGTMFRIRVVLPNREQSAGHDIAGDIAGERLHFVARGDTLESFAAMPVDSTSGVVLTLTCSDGTMPVHSHSERVHATDGAYRLEKLTVAPRFGTAPDSALAARMQREAERSAAVSRGAHETPRLWTSAFIAPRESRITSGFGIGRTFNGQVTSRHTGTDYAGAVGAPIRAINRGVVRIVDSFYLGGNVVYIDHGAGVVSAYLHLSKHAVAVGDTVSRGQVIGQVGATGRVTGPHLHLITRYGLTSVDATTLIGKR